MKFEINQIRPNIFELYHNREIDELQNKIIQEIVRQQEMYIEYILRNHVKPIIKGDITAGKIKWRGLELVNDAAFSRMWIRQRGVDINPYLDYAFNYTRKWT